MVESRVDSRRSPTERRLRIPHRLVAERLSLVEFATEFGLSKTTIHHHLGTLRAAGLIHLRNEPGRRYSFPFPGMPTVLEPSLLRLDALEAYLTPEESR